MTCPGHTAKLSQSKGFRPLGQLSQPFDTMALTQPRLCRVCVPTCTCVRGGGSVCLGVSEEPNPGGVGRGHRGPWGEEGSFCPLLPSSESVHVWLTLSDVLVTEGVDSTQKQPPWPRLCECVCTTHIRMQPSPLLSVCSLGSLSPCHSHVPLEQTTHLRALIIWSLCLARLVVTVS